MCLSVAHNGADLAECEKGAFAGDEMEQSKFKTD